jgi:opacity protein-like surface antigen
MRLLPAVLIGLTLSIPASAQEAELGVTGGYGSFREGDLASFGGGAGDSTIFEYTGGVRIGARMSFYFRNYFAHEAAYVFQSAKFAETTNTDSGATQTVLTIRSQIHTYSYNFTAHATPRGSRVRPFVTGGGGVSAFIPPGYSSFQARGETKFGYNYGAGVKFLLSDKWGLRFDARDHRVGKPFFDGADGMLRLMEISTTVSYLF